MSRLLCIASALVFLNATSASATFLIDDFEIPAAGSQDASGSTQALTAPNFFENRLLDGDAPVNLVISSGSIDGVFLANQTAFIEWSVPTTTPAPFASLEFENFVGTVLTDITYDVTLNGTSINGGPQAFTSGVLSTNAATIASAGDLLRVTFTTGATGFAVFAANGIQANPEPVSAGLLGLAMFGGICRHRRRRRSVK
jgi:MYXO-CTERM domain-containing protein